MIEITPTSNDDEKSVKEEETFHQQVPSRVECT
jgi:hypothetical protein